MHVIRSIAYLRILCLPLFAVTGAFFVISVACGTHVRR